MEPKYAASTHENLLAVINIFCNVLEVASMVIDAQAYLVMILLLFMRKWKYALIAFAVGVSITILHLNIEPIIAQMQKLGQAEDHASGGVIASILIAGSLAIFIAILGSVLIPIVVGKIRKKKLIPICALMAMNFLIPVLYPWALWLALRDEKEPQE